MPSSSTLAVTTTALVMSLGWHLPAFAADAAHPEVIELFQSQGCSSCPPANAAVMALTAGRPDLLLLSWQVTYWDDLGWRDTFGDPAFTERQNQYAQAWHRSNVFTPQVVVNGRVDLIGSDPTELAAVVRAQDRGDGGPGIAPAIAPAITLGRDGVTVSGGTAGARAADVVLVRYDPRIIEVPIARGENRGRTLPHRDVVRQVVTLGSWVPGTRAHWSLPPAGQAGLVDAILVQLGPGGPILAAARGGST